MGANALSGFFKRVEEKRSNARLVEHFIAYRKEINKPNNTGASMLDSLCHMA